MIGDIPVPDYANHNELEKILQQINQLTVDAMAVTNRPQITITRLIDNETLTTLTKTQQATKMRHSQHI